MNMTINRAQYYSTKTAVMYGDFHILALSGSHVYDYNSRSQYLSSLSETILDLDWLHSFLSTVDYFYIS